MKCAVDLVSICVISSFVSGRPAQRNIRSNNVVRSVTLPVSEIMQCLFRAVNSDWLAAPFWIQCRKQPAYFIAFAIKASHHKTWAIKDARPSPQRPRRSKHWRRTEQQARNSAMNKASQFRPAHKKSKWCSSAHKYRPLQDWYLITNDLLSTSNQQQLSPSD